MANGQALCAGQGRNKILRRGLCIWWHVVGVSVLLLSASSTLRAAADILASIEQERRQLENAPIVTADAIRPALKNIAVCLERGWQSEAVALAITIDHASNRWSNLPEASALNTEFQFRLTQIQSRECRANSAKERFTTLRAQITETCPDLIADLDDEVGIIAAWEGRFTEAAEMHRAAIANRRSHRDENGLARSLNLLGAAELASGRSTAAKACLDEAREIFSRLRDERGIAITRMNQAVLQRAKGELLAAHSELSAVLEFARANGHTDIEADALINDAAVLEAVGRYQEALAAATPALRLQESHDNCRALARAYLVLGILHRKTGDYGQADKEFTTALELARKYGDRMGGLAARNNLGWLLLALNQPDKARDIFLTLRNERHDLHDASGEADELENLGAAQLSLTNIPAARIAFNEALQLRRGLSNTTGVASLLINLGACDVKEGNAALAVPRFEEARTLAIKVGATPLEASAWNNLGFAHKSDGQLGEARNAYEQARLLRGQMGDPVAEAVTLNNLMALAQAEDRPAVAIFYGKQSVSKFQSVRKRLLWLPAEAQKNFTSYCQPAYRRLADLLVESGRLPEAQQVITMLKEAERFEFNQRNAGVADSQNTIVGQTPTEADWKQKYDAIGSQVIALSEERALLAVKGEAKTQAERVRLEQLISDLGAAQKAMALFLKAIGEETPRREEIASMNLGKVRAMQETLKELGPGTVLLHYVVGPENIRIILTTPNGQVGRSANISEKELNRKVFAFRETLRSGRLQDPLPQSQELYRLLLGPVERDLAQTINKTRTLMVSLDGTLRYLPLAALHDGSGYVVEKYRVALFTIAGMATLNVHPQSKWSATGLGLTRKVGTFSELPFVEDELRGIVKERGAKSGVLPGVILLDTNFTAIRLEDAAADNQPVLHIASHFVFCPGTVKDSYLLLGDGNTLSLETIQNRGVNFHKDLVTLSACETGVSETQPGNGPEVEGLTTEVQLLGAKGILSTLWPVNDESTSLLMREFYQLRQANPDWPKVEALRQVQIRLLRGVIKPTKSSARRAAILSDDPGVKPSKDFSHPYFWAPFVLTGNWQ